MAKINSNYKNELEAGILHGETDGMGIPIRTYSSSAFDFAERAQFYVSTCVGLPFIRLENKKDRAMITDTYRYCMNRVLQYGILHQNDIKKRIMTKLKSAGFHPSQHAEFLKKHAELCPLGWVEPE
jgi:hypothetical protein